MASPIVLHNGTVIDCTRADPREKTSPPSRGPSHRQGGSGSDLLGPMQLGLKAQVMPPMAALVSAIRSNAQLSGMADRIGTLEEGKWADVIVVSGSPIDDIAVLRDAGNISLVVKGGQVLKNLLS